MKDRFSDTYNMDVGYEVVLTTRTPTLHDMLEGLHEGRKPMDLIINWAGTNQMTKVAK
jgi:hypothetical protein